jgi:molecular chaperone DnaK (HSP70)
MKRPILCSSTSLIGILFLLSPPLLELSGAPVTLKKPIGIITAGNVFSEVIPAGTPLPHTYSDSFGTAADNQPAVEITIGQKDKSGLEKILVATIDNLPKRPKGKLSVIVTVTVDPQKKLRLKAAVPETGYLKQFPPMPVE